MCDRSLERRAISASWWFVFVHLQNVIMRFYITGIYWTKIAGFFVLDLYPTVISTCAFIIKTLNYLKHDFLDMNIETAFTYKF